MHKSSTDETKRDGNPLEVFIAFIALGLTSFGGPLAHLGYFHRSIVVRRRWVDDAQYAQLLAMCQLLPGPASSQLGFLLGLIRAGWLGALAAFCGFTLPSAVLMVLFAYALPSLLQPLHLAILDGLKLLALAVVAHGVLTLAKRLTPDVARGSVALVAALVAVTSSSAVTQLVAIAAGAVAGLLVCSPAVVDDNARGFASVVGSRMGFVLLAGFGVLFLAAVLVSGSGAPMIAMAAAFYRVGALVFGGGHVVLPLLQENVVASGWMPAEDFIAGYGAAQAVPGPLFSIAAFIGARIADAGVVGALLGVVAIFLPGLLLAAGMLSFWSKIARQEKASRAMAGVNAVVVGLLAAAVYDPLWKTAVHTPTDLVIALAAFALLLSNRIPLLLVVAFCALASIVRHLA